jgi:deazaflavin-dependent oxidoreductase (nitroreductase family)
MAARHPQVRQFAKRYFNPLARRFAGTIPPFALLRHVGRRSGTPYETPITVMRKRAGFVIALPYGPGVDWYRNLAAAGEATLIWRRRPYTVSRPQLLEARVGLRAFPRLTRPILRLTGARDFVYLSARPGGAAGPPAAERA